MLRKSLTEQTHLNQPIRLAEQLTGVTTLGPGRRLALWFQGCSLHCPGCLAPELRSHRGGAEIGADRLVRWAAGQAGHDGVTISGGEPFEQVEGLAALVTGLRRRTSLDLLLFTGFRWEELQRRARRCGRVRQVLDQIDALVDGRYVHALNDSRGLRGSANQRLFLRGARLASLSSGFDAAPRRIEVRPLGDGTRMMIGIPPLAEWRRVHLREPDQWYRSSAELGSCE